MSLCGTYLQDGGLYQFIRKIATHFRYFNLLTLPSKWKFLYIPPTPFYYTLLTARPPTF